MQRLILALAIAASGLLFADNAEAQRRPVRPLPPRRPPAAGVPELDPNAAGAALALLLGGVAVVLAGRRREV